MNKSRNSRRLLTVIMDGIGERASNFGNAVALAQTPTLDYLREFSTYTPIMAHGTYVGLPSDSDIGNSEVGHNAIGAGKIYDQGAKLVDQAILSGSMYNGPTWLKIINRLKENNHTLHFIGLLSDGNVHSHENHLYAMLHRAFQDGIKHIRLHPLFDGRDVGEKSAEVYVARLESICTKLKQEGCDIEVASGGGRMSITMDRYGADWNMVERGWHAHVLGQAPFQFNSLSNALHTFRTTSNTSDQYLPAFIIVKEGKPVGEIKDGDAVIFFNFRGDRALEISKAFEQEDFTHFDRKRFPKVLYAGMMEYDGDEHVPKNFLVAPPAINDTLSEHLVTLGLHQYACSETQKFGHVTYFWNGNKTGYLDPSLEEYLEIPSDNLPFDQKPWMKAWEITEATIKRMYDKSFDFGRINFANGDMVGHTGNLEASIIAVACIDMMLTKLIYASQKTGVILLITADHGNCEQMFEGKEEDYPFSLKHPLLKTRPQPKTSHTLSPVPVFIYDPSQVKWQLNTSIHKPGLANLANTILVLLGIKERDIYAPSLILRS